MSRNLDVTNLIKLTAAGLDVATFIEIRSALIRRYQATYGSDIDLSTGSADGIFVNDLALIINNILQTCKNLYSNLDVNYASGVYLDSLCRLSNIRRLPATASTAALKVKNIMTGDTASDILLSKNTEFVDRSSMIWIYTGENITLSPNNDYQVISVVCSEKGPVKAPAGWIINTVEIDDIDVIQENDASVGTNTESDSDLRARRNRSLSFDSVTVLESLSAALLNITGIKDVLIYENNSSRTINNVGDGTEIQPHSVYVIIRQDENVDILPSQIGTIIFEKMTPGILTNETGATAEENYSYNYLPSLINEEQVLDLYNQIVYWKKPLPIHPKIDVTITTKTYFDNSEIEQIALSVIEYCNNLRLNQSVDLSELWSVVYEADPEFKGNRTYSIASNDVTIADTVNDYTYYNYTKFESATDTVDTNKIKISIS